MAGNIKHSPDDRLSRFIRSKRHVAETKRLVKLNAFMPPSNKILSVFHTQRINEFQIWQLADEHLPTDKPIRIRADISVRNVSKANLSIDWNYRPKYHVDIIGWPDGKDDQKARALELAKHSELIIRSNKHLSK